MELAHMIDRRLSLGSTATIPSALIVVGPIGVGKTTYRKTQLPEGYVHLDSADIFHELSAGDPTFNFPDDFALEIEESGRTLTREALRRRLNIVLETPGHEPEAMIRVINSLKSIGYAVEVVGLTAEYEVCEERHASRGDSVSSYWAAPIHMAWVVAECEALAEA